MTLTAQRDAKSMLNEVRARGAELAESEIWAPFVEDIENDFKRYSTALVLENARRYMLRKGQLKEGTLQEITQTIQIGDFQKYAFPLIRAIFPELVAQSLVSVQPLLSPTSQVFFMDFAYGTTKGTVNRGQRIFDSLGLGTSNPYYSSPTIDAEPIGTGTGATAAFTWTTLFSPVRAASVYITDGAQVITDDGNGGLIGDAVSGSINYSTGAVAVTFTANPANGAVVSIGYDYQMEAQPNIPEVDLIMSSSPVISRPRKLRARWSLESAFDLRTLHGIEAEVELTAAVGAEIRFEIDREIINDLRNSVPASNLAPIWSKSKMFKDSDPFSGPASGAADVTGYTEHNLSLVNQFLKGSNLIFRSTGRAAGQWIVIGMDVADIIEALPGFVPTPGTPNGMVKGVYQSGVLNGRWTIFKDPFFPANEWLMGYKGSTFLEAGYVYAPYIPLYSTPTIVLDDFIGRKGLATSYARKAVNSRFYARGMVTA